MMGRLAIPAERVARALSQLLLACYDLLAITAAYFLALTLHADHIPWTDIFSHLASLPVVLLTGIVIFHAFRLYRYHWQFAGAEVLGSVLLANIAVIVIGAFWQAEIDGSRMPGSVLIISALLATALVGGQRIALRLSMSWLERSHYGRNHERWGNTPKRTIVLGGQQSTVEVLATLARESCGSYDVIGILDDDARHHGSYFRGIKILGGLEKLSDLLASHAIDEAIIALPNANSDQLREYVLACCRHKVAVRVMPVIAELLENPSALPSHVRGHVFTAEDLLHRPPVEVPKHDIGRHLTGRRVLVTGAGGSIGAELCRQISHLNPALLILLGHGENSINEIERELHHDFPELTSSAIAIICDTRDEGRVDQVVGHFRPQVIFHAAAHKHVPMMEENIAEAVTNNIKGTRNLARAATKHSVERMVMISTDKAVNPSSVMGATKFLCEEVVRAEALHSATCFVTVRFGNVLGSRGSVLPYFQQQIVRGGPVTVTHPEMTRYFMTIPEAVSLVLQAGAVGRTGDLFVLDMGRPVRILDLAEDLIRLSGLEPYRDIDITFCGVRPGEKITEELFTEREQRNTTTHDRLSVVNRPQYLESSSLNETIDDLLEIAAHNNDREVLAKLQRVIPTFRQAPKPQPTPRVERPQLAG